MALALETFDVKAMLDALVDTVGPVVQQNDNSLTVRCSDDVGEMTADLMKTRQILLNLLSNAGKFTRNGAVTLQATRGLIGGQPAVTFTVTDSGVGMTPQQTDKIFDAFTQADVTTTRKYGGTGSGSRDRVAILPADGRNRVGREPAAGRIVFHRHAADRSQSTLEANRSLSADAA